MSLNFSDDEDEVYEKEGIESNNDVRDGDDGDNVKPKLSNNFFTEKNDYGDLNEDVYGEEPKEDVAGEEEANEEMKKARKKSGENNDNMGGDSEEEEETEEEKIRKYIKEQNEKIKQILPEKDEFWDIYMYLNLKKKRRKIDYNEKEYTAAVNKILEAMKNEYKNVLNEKLFKNEKLKEYLIITDSETFYKNSKIENIDKNITFPMIRKSNLLTEMKKGLLQLYYKGNCFNYLKEINYEHVNANEGKEGYEGYEDTYDENNITDNEEKEGYREMYDEKYTNNNDYRVNDKNNDNYYYFDKNRMNRINENAIIESEKINLELSRLYNKYNQMIQKIKHHKKKSIRTNLNIFMNLITEVFSKLYLTMNNALMTYDKNTNLIDLYKTIRRKYNIHDVLSKIQKLTKKKEVYEHYRSYLLYKYKTTYNTCQDLFNTHVMQDSINIFNFKQFYNTEFSSDDFGAILEQQHEEDTIFSSSVFAKKFNLNPDIRNNKSNKTKEAEKTQFMNDEVYSYDTFFDINAPSKVPDNDQAKTTATNAATATTAATATGTTAATATGTTAATATTTTTTTTTATTDDQNKENLNETPLERAKRLAREKKKKLLESRIKII
ncbi:conserved protein, unknown function [Hepatocystis sp. ex Piliocolobus tephrosceles]|nr:conserved protein, unknown function [Hepatocystis sp. ex Piliocolobus tephrosceles]